MEIEEIKEKQRNLTLDEFASFMHTAITDSYDEGVQDGKEEAMNIDEHEDSKGGIAFCLKELEEAKERGLTIDDMIRDLTIRSCRFIPPTLRTNRFMPSNILH